MTFPNAQETLWSCDHVDIENVSAKGDYFGMNTNNLIMKNFQLVGNYSFDGSRNVEVHDSKLISKDAFWNTENVTFLSFRLLHRLKFLGASTIESVTEILSVYQTPARAMALA